MVARLIQRAELTGFRVTLGEAWRPGDQAALNAIGKKGREFVASLIDDTYPDLAKELRARGAARGILRSLHRDRLAIDLNLFLNGTYLRNSEAYRPLGEWWQKQSRPPDIICVWGGSWSDQDGTHFSIRHEGRE